jgi:hypothetical protein
MRENSASKGVAHCPGEPENGTRPAEMGDLDEFSLSPGKAVDFGDLKNKTFAAVRSLTLREEECRKKRTDRCMSRVLNGVVETEELLLILPTDGKIAGPGGESLGGKLRWLVTGDDVFNDRWGKKGQTNNPADVAFANPLAFANFVQRDRASRH